MICDLKELLRHGASVIHARVWPFDAALLTHGIQATEPWSIPCLLCLLAFWYELVNTRQTLRCTPCSCAKTAKLNMDVSEPTPRVNFDLMQRHMHKKVLLVGQIESRDNNVARLRAADGGIVQVMVQPGVMFESKFIQFEGIVESPTQLSALNHTNFGDNLGENACKHLQ